MTAIHNELLERVRHSLADEGAEPTPARVAAAVRAEGRLLGHDDVLELVDTLRRDAFGAGPLDALLREPEVTDIVVNSPDAVYIDRGDGLERTAVSFSDERDVRRLAQRLAAAGGRRLDDASPFVDVRLHDGTRFHAVLSPIAHPGTVLSLRVPARRAFTLEMLQVCGTLTPVAAGLLRDLVDARLAFLVSGGTGSGKTTLLATLLSLIGGRERLVLVEDVAELRPEHDHVVGLEARPPNVEGAGTITVRDLVRQALRMRPDRLVVGEVRGAEVVDLLAALNTGHQGGCGTLHANSAGDVPARLEALGVAAGLGRQAVHSQLASAVQVVVHVVRPQRGPRFVSEIAILRVRADGLVGCQPAVRFHPDGTAATGPGADRLKHLLRGADEQLAGS